MIKFLKKPSVIISLVILVVGIIGGYAYFGRDKAPTYDFVIAKKQNLIQEVSVTGRVKPAKSVNLAFEKSGKVSRVYADVGDKVKVGQTLVALENSELSSLLLQAQAGVEGAKAKLTQYEAALAKEQVKLDELKKGAREEEIQFYKTKVANAKRSLVDTENNLEDVKQKTAADLNDAYNDALTAAQDAVTFGKAALLTLTDIQYAHYTVNDQEGIIIADKKAIAVKYLLGADNAGRWTTSFISTLDGGAFGTVQKAVNNQTHENIDKALIETIDALQKVKQALDVVPVTSDLTETEKINLSTEKNNINSKITTVSGKQMAITVQKATNVDRISTAEASVTNAQNTLASAEDDLALKQAGTREEQITAQQIQIRTVEAEIASQKSQIKQAEANVANYQAQIAKTIIHAPISGIIIKQDAKVGEIISANTSIVSLISASQFEIEANVPEADIAKVAVGNGSLVTLDVYGRDIVFEAKVVVIDPAETIVEGVATYKVTFQFVKNDERVKSGMTANIDIKSASRENVIAVPQRAIIRKNGDQFVRIADGESFREVKVETGLRGSDGNIEIISGVNEGDKVITFSKE